MRFQLSLSSIPTEFILTWINLAIFFALQMTADELREIEDMERLPIENVSNFIVVFVNQLTDQK